MVVTDAMATALWEKLRGQGQPGSPSPAMLDYCREALVSVFSVSGWEQRTEREWHHATESRDALMERTVLVGPWVPADDLQPSEVGSTPSMPSGTPVDLAPASQDEPDFLDELEAELAARRPVPVQQDEPEVCVDCGSATTVCQCFGVPVQQDEPECDHVWRSSFGDTFCEKCNQDAPVEIASERCRTCKGSGTWSDESWVKPPQPCKACSGSGRVPAKRKAAPSVPEAAPLPRSRPPRSHRDDESLRRWEARHPSVRFPPAVPVQQDEPEAYCKFCRDETPCTACGRTQYARDADLEAVEPTVPVQQEPELDGSEVNAAGGSEKGAPSVLKHHACRTYDRDVLVHTLIYHQRMDSRCCLCGWDRLGYSHADHVADVYEQVVEQVEPAAVPSVGLRDRVACELANLEYERSGRPCETEDFYANADRVLSVLHEAGEQGDAGRIVVSRDDSEVVVSRTDLEWAVGMIEDEWTGERGMLLHPDHDPIYARLRAVLNTENQT